MIGTMAFSLIFSVIFLNIFLPISEMTWFHFGNSMLFLFSSAFIILSLGFLAVSRIGIYHSKKWFRMTYLVYVLWSLAEVIIICLIYTILSIFVVGHDEFNPVHLLWRALLYGCFALLVPYTISGMYLTVLDRNRTIMKLTARNAMSFMSGQTGGGDERISLYDVGGSLRLSIKASNLYYIESDDNYIKVWYMDNKDEMCTRMIRCRLKTVEDRFKDSSLIRCNRKYIVNLDRVKLLSKEADGYYLDLGIQDIEPIAVTKTYQANVLSKFSEK